MTDEFASRTSSFRLSSFFGPFQVSSFIVELPMPPTSNNGSYREWWMSWRKHACLWRWQYWLPNGNDDACTGQRHTRGTGWIFIWEEGNWKSWIQASTPIAHTLICLHDVSRIRITPSLVPLHLLNHFVPLNEMISKSFKKPSMAFAQKAWTNPNMTNVLVCIKRCIPILFHGAFAFDGEGAKRVQKEIRICWSAPSLQLLVFRKGISCC